ncbi:MAG TPA: MFS transporter [Thermoanaerobaculia bacterium]|nr:MFS transporter [Thermoanaerobaculia bacterium]
MATHDPYAALRVRNFLWLILGYATSTVAREAQIVVVGWQVFEATRDPLALGMIGLAEALPFIAVSLYAGHVADRLPRRPIAIAGTFAMVLSAIALLLFTTSGMIGKGHVWPIYLVIFLSGIARSFIRPAFTALSAEVVTRDLFANAVAWRSSTWQFAAVLGPAIGGLIYGFAGAAAAYVVVTVMMSLSLGALWLIDHDARPQQQGEEMPISESLRIGIRFIVQQKILLAAMTLDLFSVLFGGAVALLPIFAHLLGAGPQGLGILRAAPAAGSLVTGIIVAHRQPMRRTGHALFASVAIFGLTMIFFAISRNFWISLALLTISGMADNISVIIRGTLLQTLTPQHMLGRVSSVNQIFIGSSNEIGAFESGLAARLLGTVPSVIFGGIMTLLVVAVTMAWAPQLRKMREIDPR